ncbi:hypothetical protein SY88_07295 [Clostridiales bacterium PH28_bin88]|nr:hypothetical protein SY88_07295 [Clostridiales bacterium PH28_bin88]
MSMNRLIRQSLTMFEEAAAMPFEIIRRTWGDQSSTTGQTVRQMASLAEGMATMPFRFTRDFFEDNSMNQAGQTAPAAGGQPAAIEAQQPQ